MLESSWADEPLPVSWLSLIDLRRLRTRGRRREDELARWKREWKRAAWEVLSACERFGALLGLANLLIFLYNGKYVLPTTLPTTEHVRLVAQPALSCTGTAL